MKEFTGYKKGVNLGGWLSQCNHTAERYDTFISEDDIKRIASWGCDHIRLPVDYNLVETEAGESKESGYSYIDKCFEWCGDNNLNLILDLHKTFGYTFTRPETAKDLFGKEELQLRLINLWVNFTKRYGKYSNRAAFEILNELVLYEVAESWNKLAGRVTSEIRGYAPDIKILIGGVCYNAVSTVALLDPPADENIVYNFHCYEPLLFSHQGAHWIENMPASINVKYPDTIDNFRKGTGALNKDFLSTISDPRIADMGTDFFEVIFSEAVKAAEERGVPLYCGEYGVIDKAPLDGTLNWFKDINAVFEKHKIGRAAWTYKELDFGLTDGHYAPILDELVKYL